MAEAVVEDPHRYFCHKCSLEINRVLPDYTCPQCCCGFIEALDSQSATPADQAEDSDEEIDVVQPWEILNDVFLTGMNGEPLLDVRRHGSRGRRGRDGDRRPGRNNRTPRHAIENLVHLFVMNWSGNGRGNMGGGRAGGPEFFLGNPGDYAWGREGLDAIVTQLLNQMEATGPPPLTKEKIDEIPVVVITQDQVDKALQCSVCWENFKVDEPVRKLVCTHVYHEGCIIPWLELHGTCPVCRKPQSSEAEEAAANEDVGREQTLASFAAELSTPLNHSNTSRALGNAITALLRTNTNPMTPGAPGVRTRSASSGAGATSSTSSFGSGESNTSHSDVPPSSSSSNSNEPDMDVD